MKRNSDTRNSRRARYSSHRVSLAPGSEILPDEPSLMFIALNSVWEEDVANLESDNDNYINQIEKEHDEDEIPSPRTEFILALSIGVSATVIAGSILLISLGLNGYFTPDTGKGAALHTQIPPFESDSALLWAFPHKPANNLTISLPINRSSDIPIPRMIPPPIAQSPDHIPFPLTTPHPATLYIPSLPRLSIQPHSICRSSSSTLKPLTSSVNNLLIAIITDPEDALIRSDYRQVWRHYLPLVRGELVFLLALPPAQSVQEKITKEAQKFGDLLQIETLTNPQTKYLKTLAALNWTADNCPNVKFILRMNVDVLIQPQSLRQFIDDSIGEGLHLQPLIIGDLIGAEEREMPSQLFMYGPIYFISKAAFRAVVEACRWVKPIAMEEMYLTGLCADYGGVKRLRVRDYEMEREFELWRKMFSCMPGNVLSVSNVGKDSVLYYWYKAARAGCYLL
ncbi:hypothetical protein BV898_17015 [Hypsibius exemplaris]|uniref:Hexosyltransferase n=1 Tax=Hypsibius exemplaris TaxID=2072580 RepID=A0A9X6RLR1_HYPEX|nr:hypothetical protein BV898_17015 [Hypsibius exemplaris]